MRITLLQKPGKTSAENFRVALQESMLNLKGDLEASTKILGMTDNGWARVEIDGVDSEIVQEIISRELHWAQTDLAHVENQTNYAGIVDSVGAELKVDIGIETPAPVTVRISSRSLRAQLCDGQLLPCSEIAEQYCLRAGSRLAVRTTKVDRETGTIEGWLADSQMDDFANRIRSHLQRVQVFDCTRQTVDSALRSLKLERDIIAVEMDTLTTQSVLCKLGTDAIGIIPRLGTALRKIELKPFLPSRIIAKCRSW
jgi:hypothetical protein